MGDIPSVVIILLIVIALYLFYKKNYLNLSVREGIGEPEEPWKAAERIVKNTIQEHICRPKIEPIYRVGSCHFCDAIEHPFPMDGIQDK